MKKLIGQILVAIGLFGICLSITACPSQVLADVDDQVVTPHDKNCKKPPSGGACTNYGCPSTLPTCGLQWVDWIYRWQCRCH